MCNLLITPFVMDDTVYRVFASSTVNCVSSGFEPEPAAPGSPGPSGSSGWSSSEPINLLTHDGCLRASRKYTLPCSTCS